MPSAPEAVVHAIVARQLTVRVIDVTVLRLRTSLELNIAIRRTCFFAGAWRRYCTDRNILYIFQVFSRWLTEVVQGPRREQSPERTASVERTAERYEEWLEEQEFGGRFNLRRAAGRWRFQISLLSGILRLRLVNRVQFLTTSTPSPLVLHEDLWWRIRAYLWVEACNPTLHGRR